MTEEQQKEQFSIAYVRAIAAVAGVKADRPETDDDSVDLRLSIKSIVGKPLPPLVEVQLKCTSENILRPDGIHFELRRNNYDELRGQRLIPRYLIVLLVPASLGDWIRQAPEELALRKCAYWLSLVEHPETENQASVTVTISPEQIFSVQTLAAWLPAGIQPGKCKSKTAVSSKPSVRWT